MRRLVLIAAALAVGAFGFETAAQQAQQGEAAEDGTKITGTVTSADEETGEITIDGETFVMPEHGGAALFPQEGDEVTLFYEEEGGEKVITRIGQAQQ